MSGYPDSHLTRTIGTGIRRYLVALIPFVALLIWFAYLWSVSGVIITTEKYPGGKTSAEGYLKRSATGEYLRHGKWTTYHPNGVKSGEGTYDSGRKLGDWVYWDEEGNSIESLPIEETAHEDGPRTRGPRA